jgi:hypothetical protein
MPNMTLNDLRTSLQNFMPVWVDIDMEDDGEIVVHTRLRENENGELVPIEEEDDT